MIVKALAVLTVGLSATALAFGTASRTQAKEDAAFVAQVQAQSAQYAENARQIENGDVCFEDEDCWTGSHSDDRRGAELVDGFESTGWKRMGSVGDWSDCWILVGETSLLRCMNGTDAVVVDTTS